MGSARQFIGKGASFRSGTDAPAAPPNHAIMAAPADLVHFSPSSFPPFFYPRLTPVTRRQFATGGGALAAISIIHGTSFAAVANFMVAADGSGTHRTLEAALAAAPDGAAPWIIQLAPGRYREKLVIRRPNIHLRGAGRDSSILLFGAAAGHAKPAGGNWGTYGSATLTVEADGFVATDLCIKNDFDYIDDLKTGASGGAQAVALALGPSAASSRLERVAIVGHQDSLYLREGRAVIVDSLIAGNVDFIFGGADARFEGCEIRARHRPGQTIQGYIAAPSTPRTQDNGLMFRHCRLTREAAVPDRSLYLGRPWRAGGNLQLLGAARYEGCWMDAHIHPDGWASMGYRGPDGQRMTLMPGDARFYEFSSSGPGRWGRPDGRFREMSGNRTTTTPRHSAHRHIEHAGQTREERA